MQMMEQIIFSVVCAWAIIIFHGCEISALLQEVYDVKDHSFEHILFFTSRLWFMKVYKMEKVGSICCM